VDAAMRTIMRNQVHLLLAVAGLVLLFQGCARPPFTHEPLPAAESIWEQFKRTETDPLRAVEAKASVRFSAEGRRHRVVLTLWGNWDLPFRMDIRAGIGNMLLHARQDDQGLLLYFPAENRAYIQPRESGAPIFPGFDLPFSLKELALVLTNRWSEIIPDSYARFQKTDGGYRFFFPDDSQVESVVLDSSARPVLITGSNSTTWMLEPADWSRGNGQWAAGRTTVSLGTGERAVALIKEFDFLGDPWSSDELFLQPPDSVLFHPLSP
ncbi:MAG: hypothetical protein ACOC0U_03085, partial [Desulfovibrionales bacterium]